MSCRHICKYSVLKHAKNVEMLLQKEHESLWRHIVRLFDQNYSLDGQYIFSDDFYNNGYYCHV